MQLTLWIALSCRYGTSSSQTPQSTNQACKPPSSTTKRVRLLPYLDRVSRYIQKDAVDDVYNPRGDGNCGFRSLAKALLGDEKFYKQVKNSMLATYSKNKQTLYKGYNHKRLPITLDENSNEWFINFECSQIAADTYGLPIAIYGRQSYLFLPCNITPSQARSLNPIVLLYVGGKGNDNGNHIVWVKIKKGAIIKWPSIDPFRKAIVTKDVTTDPWYIVFPDVFHHTVDPGVGSSRSVPKTPADSYYISSEESDTEEVLDWTTSS